MVATVVGTLAAHIDKDDVNSGIVVGLGKDGGSMAFPEYKARMLLGPLDVGVFPSSMWHGAEVHPNTPSNPAFKYAQKLTVSMYSNKRQEGRFLASGGVTGRTIQHRGAPLREVLASLVEVGGSRVEETLREARELDTHKRAVLQVKQDEHQAAATDAPTQHWRASKRRRGPLWTVHQEVLVESEEGDGTLAEAVITGIVPMYRDNPQKYQVTYVLGREVEGGVVEARIHARGSQSAQEEAPLLESDHAPGESPRPRSRKAQSPKKANAAQRGRKAPSPKKADAAQDLSAGAEPIKRAKVGVAFGSAAARARKAEKDVAKRRAQEANEGGGGV